MVSRLQFMSTQGAITRKREGKEEEEKEEDG